MIKNLRYGLRKLIAKPGFSLVAIVTLALGISANTTIFTLIDSILLKPLPYDDPARIVGFWGDGSWSRGELQFMREHTSSYRHLAAFAWSELTLTGLDEPLAVSGVEASANLFSVLGAQAGHGRVFRPEEEEPGKARVAVLADRLWRRDFGADPAVVGRTITINGTPFEVVGVMPQAFKFPRPEAELWIPLEMDPSRGGYRRAHYLAMIGRLGPGVSLAAAQSELEAVVPELATEFELPAGFDKLATPPAVMTFQEQLVGDTRPALVLLLAAVGFVLLIACANVANLLLARAAGRHREIAVRSALGASRANVIGQLLAESAVLAVAGGAFGLLLATWGVDLVVASLPAGSPRLDEIAVDPRVLAFCAALTMLTVLLFGLAPALQTSRADLRQSLAEGGRSGLEIRRRGARKALVVAEVALASVLAVAAGLMGRSFYRLITVDPGFDASSALTFRVDLSAAGYGDQAQRAAFYDRLFERIGALPGVESAGANWRLPIDQKGAYQLLEVEAVPDDPEGGARQVYWRSVAGRYFQTMGIPLLAGRDLSPADRPDTTPVCVINRTMAERFWPDSSPLGQRIRNSMDDDTWLTIVGVVGDVKHNGLDQAADLMMYRPFAQSPPWISNLSVVVRSALPAESLTASVRAELEKTNYDRQQALWDKRISAEATFLQARATYSETQLRLNLARQKLSALGLNADEVAAAQKRDEATPNQSSLRRYELRSPLTGRVVERKVDVGTTVGGQGDPADLYTVADLSTVWVELAVPTTDLAKVREGAEVLIAPRDEDAGQRAKGKIIFVSPILNAETRSARVIAALPNQDFSWRPGTFVTHPLPEPFWNKLERDCTFGRNVTDGDATHCDFLVIGHNTNLGGGGPLVSLLDATAARASPPDWSVVQVAAWVLAKDVDLDSVRDARYMSNRLSHHVVIMGEQRRVAPSVETIDEARRLLAEAGFATGSARLFAEAEAALQDGLAATWEPRRALQALDQLDFFRSRGTVERLALRVLGDARGPDWEGGGAERRAAAQLLGHRLLDVMDDEVERERLVTVLREARAREFEPKVLSEIDGSLRLAERAADKS